MNTINQSIKNGLMISKTFNHHILRMFKFITILWIGFLSLHRINSQPSWEWINPFPQGNNIKDIFFINSQIGFAVGNAYSIMKKVNDKWYLTYSYPTEKSFNCVRFTNNSHGFICGDDGILLRTTDAGNNWETIFLNASYNLNNIYFLDKSVGYICGNGGFIIKTTNSGLNWNRIFYDKKTNLKEIMFSSQDIGIVISNKNHLSVTSDNGNNWQDISLDKELEIIRILNVTKHRIQLNCKDSIQSYILESVNLGLTWTKTIAFKKAVPYMFFENSINHTNVYYDKNSIYTNSDGDNIWKLMYFQNEAEITMIKQFFNNFYAVGKNGLIILSTNYGKSWKVENSNIIYPNLIDCFQIEQSNVFLCTSNGLIYNTDNKISKSKILYSNPDYFFSSINFINNNTGYVSGGNSEIGVILKTTNGGCHWDTSLTLVKSYINKVVFIKNKGFAITTNGYLYGSTNFGVTWEIKNIKPNYKFFDIQFFNDSMGIISCSNGTILMSSDNGNIWEVKINDYSGNMLSSSHFKESIFVLLKSLDDNNYLYTSDNFGRTWSSKKIENSNNLKSIYVINDSTIIASGNSGHIIKTTNGGKYWYWMNSKTSKSINKITNIGNSLFAFGNDGCVLKMNEESNNILISSNKIPTRTEILKNYPNPFDYNTIINFNISNRGIYTIYISKGNISDTIINKQFLDIGEYSINLAPTNRFNGKMDLFLVTPITVISKEILRVSK